MFRKWFATFFTPQLKFLVVDDSVPDPMSGAGAPRAEQILRSLSRAGAAVTLFPTLKVSPSRSGPHTTRTESGGSPKSFAAFLKERHPEFDVIIVSRPHNMAFFNEACAAQPDILRAKFIVYDAEAIFASRAVLHQHIRGKSLSAEQAEASIRQELELARAAHMILAVNDAEARRFRDAGYTNVFVLGHTLTPSLTRTPHDARSHFLFVGPTQDDDTPNSDSIVWFADHVLPEIRAALGDGVRLTLVGKTGSQAVLSRKDLGIDFRGPLTDLNGVYETARVFVAPTRFAAGVPLKIYGAAAHGVPCVVTSLLASQLGWTDECELLVADTPENFARQCLRLYTDEALWARIRRAAFERVSRECDTASFDRTIGNIPALAVAQRGHR